MLDNGAPFTLTSVTGIHIRTEGGGDTINVDTGVTTPLWIYGGTGSTINDGGSGGDILDGGNRPSVIHAGYGPNLPEIVDDSDPVATGKTAYYQESGTGFSDGPTTGFDGTERVLAAGSTAVATWSFTNLDPNSCYDVYVTWSPEADASTAAQYAIYDGTTLISPQPSPVDQQIAPADDQAAGCFWHHLGVYSTASGTLVVRLPADASVPVLADAVRLVQHSGTAVPTTNLIMDSFSVDSNEFPAVTYTINGLNAAPFTIGVYESLDGVQPTTLVGTIDVSDSTDLTGDGRPIRSNIPTAWPASTTDNTTSPSSMPTTRFWRPPRATIFRPP